MSAEERIAFELASDYVNHKLGNSGAPISTEAALLRRLTEKFEVENEMLIKELWTKLDIHNCVQAHTAALSFKYVADEIFANSINWGRILVLYAFSGQIATHCSDHNINISKDEIIGWIGEYVCGLSEWIREAGGWNAFQEMFRDKHQQHWIWNGLLYTTLGVGTLMAVTLALVNLSTLTKKL